MALISKVRTESELKNPDLNYYIAFKIDLKEKDVDKIRDAVKKRRNTFAANQTVTNSRLVELAIDIDEILFNDAIYDSASGTYNRNAGGRQLEAERAKAFKIEHAVETANALCGRGYITEAEVQQIAQKNECTDKDILDKISGLFSQGIEFKKKTLIKREVPFNKFDEIETQLKTVQKKNLYDFLGLSETASAAQIETERSNIYAVAQKQGKNTQATATINLCGLIKTVFKSPQARQEYDVYYKCKNDVWDPLRLFKDSGTKTINERMLTDMSNAMRTNAGLSSADVAKELEAYLQYFNLVSEGAQDGKKLELEQCPYPDCGKSYIAKPGVTVCPNCNRSLEIICWNCGQKTLYSSSRVGCKNCGVTPKQQADFTQAFKDFETVSKRLDVTETQLNGAFNTLENVFADYKRFNTSFIYKKIQEAKKVIDKRIVEAKAKESIYEKYVKDINAAIARKEYIQAQALIKKLKFEAPSYDVKNIEQSVNGEVQKANQYLLSAKNYLKANNEALAIQNAGKALEICTDYSDAKQILKSFPPKAPTNVSFVVRKNTLKLEWNVVGDQNSITYSVLRKIGAPPVNDEDGTVVEKDLTVTFFEDTDLISATPYYYAVYAERGGIKSQIAATKTAAVIYLEVSGLHQEVVENKIKVTWIPPTNVKGIEVYKKSGLIAPTSRGDGIKITTDGLNGFTEQNSANEPSSYLIVCKYGDSKAESYSAGIRATFKNYTLPQVLTGVKLKKVGFTDFEFFSDEPINGKVSLFISQKRFNFGFGKVEERSSFARKCGELTKVDSIDLDDRLSFTVPKDKIFWLYPIVSNDQLYIMSEPCIINTKIGIDGLNVITKDDGAIIEGNLSSNVRKLIAKISDKDYPESIEDPCEQRICSKEAFVKDKGFYIGLKPGRYYISIFAEFQEGGEIVYSGAARLPEVIDNREKKIVKFLLEYDLSVRQAYKVKVTFYAETPMTIPATILVKGTPKPLLKNAGVEVTTLKECELKKKFLKSGYWATQTIVVEPAGNLKEKLALFFDSDQVKHLRLKEVMSF